jgi:hypothetical protein
MRYPEDQQIAVATSARVGTSARESDQPSFEPQTPDSSDTLSIKRQKDQRDAWTTNMEYEALEAVSFA